MVVHLYQKQLNYIKLNNQQQTRRHKLVMKVNQSYVQQPNHQLFHFTDEQLTEWISGLEKQQVTQEQYDNLLKLWIQYDEQRAENVVKLAQIVNMKQKKHKNVKVNSTCLVCFEQIKKKANQKTWCRMCGMECCIKCIGRFRVMNKNNSLTTVDTQMIEDNNPAVPCCIKCDKIYMEALLALEDQKQIELRRKSYQKIQNLNEKMLKQNKIKQVHKKFNSLCSLNSNLKFQTLQLGKKISWGQDVKRKLQTQYRKLQRKFSQNIQCPVLQDMQTILPPSVSKSQQCKSENEQLNESAINSVIDDETTLIIDKGKCCACTLM